MLLNDYALQRIRIGRGVRAQTIEGRRLSLRDPIPGWGGFGNNRGSDTIIVDGRTARLVDSDRSQSIGRREVVFYDNDLCDCGSEASAV